MDVIIENTLSVNEYNELRKSVGWEEKNPTIVKMAIDNSSIVKKAILGNEIVGMARAVGDGISYLLVDVVVRKDYQKHGIGKILINSVIEAVRDKTIPGEYSTINLISISGMEKFYENCGFQSVPFDYNGAGMRMKIQK